MAWLCSKAASLVDWRLKFFSADKRWGEFLNGIIAWVVYLIPTDRGCCSVPNCDLTVWGSITIGRSFFNAVLKPIVTTTLFFLIAWSSHIKTY